MRPWILRHFFEQISNVSQWLDLPKSILLAPAKMSVCWKVVLCGPHGWFNVVFEVGKNLTICLWSLLRKQRIGSWSTRIVDWSKEWTWVSLPNGWRKQTRWSLFRLVFHERDKRPIRRSFLKIFRTCVTLEHSTP